MLAARGRVRVTRRPNACCRERDDHPVRPLRTLGTCLADLLTPMPYLALPRCGELLHLRLHRRASRRGHPDTRRCPPNGHGLRSTNPGLLPWPAATPTKWYTRTSLDRPTRPPCNRCLPGPCHPREVMTQAQPADTLAVCVNQQINRAQPCSAAGIRDHLPGPGGTTLRAGLGDGEVTSCPGIMTLRDGCQISPFGPGNA